MRSVLSSSRRALLLAGTLAGRVYGTVSLFGPDRPAIAIHVGTAPGPAAAGYIGTEHYVQHAVIGDTTTVAARVGAAAGPGEVLRVGRDPRAALRPRRGVRDRARDRGQGEDVPVGVHRVR